MSNIYKSALKDIGYKKAYILCIEELAELQEVLSTFNDKSKDHLSEEIVDVRIHLNIIKNNLGITEKEIQKIDSIENQYYLMYLSEFETDELYREITKEIARLIFALTKSLRGNKKKKDYFITRISYIEIYIDEIIRRTSIKSSIEKWSKKKKKRLKHRTKHKKVF